MNIYKNHRDTRLELLPPPGEGVLSGSAFIPLDLLASFPNLRLTELSFLNHGAYMHPVMNWPNILTMIRISLIPLLVICYYLPVYGHLIATILFIIAGFTDWLDGYLARSLQQTTKLGAFLDPVADKLIVCIVLVLIVAEPQFQFVSFHSTVVNVPAFLITVPAAIIVSRELIVSALREWMADLGKRAKVAVSYLGKVKTAVQMFSLMVLLYCDNGTNYLIVLCGYILLYVAAVLTIWSMLIYLNMVLVESQS